jgi:hypothetical protein
MSNFEGSSVPNEELASENMISEPEEIEDSQASDFSEIKKKNLYKRKNQGNRIGEYEGGSNGENEAASGAQR